MMRFAVTCTLLLGPSLALNIVNESFPLFLQDVRDLSNAIRAGSIEEHHSTSLYYKVRQSFGINETNFLDSFRADALFYTRLTSEKSGSRFFLTSNGDFLVKNVARRESHTLRKIENKYAGYMTANANDTLINPILFHARIKRGSKRSYFIVMTSSVPGKFLVGQDRMDQVFDIKGSSYDRYKDPKNVLKGDALLDNNWLSEGKKIKPIKETDQERLKFVLDRDSNFLLSCNLWDYSLLTALSHNNAQYATKRIESGIWDRGVSTREGTYFFAIIDFINAVKVTGISCLFCFVDANAVDPMIPKSYRKRWLEFVTSNVLA